MADSLQESPPLGGPAESFLRRWQLRLLPFMQAGLVVVALYFVLVGERRFTEFERALTPDSAAAGALIRRVERLADSAARAGDREFATRAALEVHALRLRYAEANTMILSRAWTRYMGFVTGMILALVGAIFVLGQLREQGTKVSGSGGGWTLALESASPGLIMAFFGSVLIGIVLTSGLDVAVNDAPVYLPGVMVSSPAREPQLGAFNPADLLGRRDSLAPGRTRRDSVGPR